MKTSYDIQDDSSLDSVVDSGPEMAASTENSEQEMGYEIMDDIKQSSSNYILEYIVIPVCILAFVGALIFLYLKFIKKSEAPQADNDDPEKDPLQETKAEEAAEPAAEAPAAETTENVGQEEAAEEKKEEAAGDAN